MHAYMQRSTLGALHALLLCALVQVRPCTLLRCCMHCWRQELAACPTLNSPCAGHAGGEQNTEEEAWEQLDYCLERGGWPKGRHSAAV